MYKLFNMKKNITTERKDKPRSLRRLFIQEVKYCRRICLFIQKKIEIIIAKVVEAEDALVCQIDSQEKTSNIVEPYNPKVIFDHVRNYTIAGAVAIGALIYVEATDKNDALSIGLLFTAFLLLAINVVSGFTLIVCHLFRKNYFNKKSNNRALAYGIAITYASVALMVCMLLFLAILKVDFLPKDR